MKTLPCGGPKSKSPLSVTVYVSLDTLDTLLGGLQSSTLIKSKLPPATGACNRMQTHIWKPPIWHQARSSELEIDAASCIEITYDCKLSCLEMNRCQSEQLANGKAPRGAELASSLRESVCVLHSSNRQVMGVHRNARATLDQIYLAKYGKLDTTATIKRIKNYNGERYLPSQNIETVYLHAQREAFVDPSQNVRYLVEFHNDQIFDKLSLALESTLLRSMLAARDFFDSLRIVKTVSAIKITRLEAPQTVSVGQPIKLRCVYDAKGDRLESLSWSKNGKEFFRYQPYERRQPLLTFRLPGVSVDLSRSKNNTVVVANTTIETSGRYKCEATGASFQTVNMETHIRVVPPTSNSSSSLLTRPHLPAKITCLLSIALMLVLIKIRTLQ